MERYSVDTDIVVCTMPLPISLSRLKKLENFIFVSKPNLRVPYTRDIPRFELGLKMKDIF